MFSKITSSFNVVSLSTIVGWLLLSRPVNTSIKNESVGYALKIKQNFKLLWGDLSIKYLGKKLFWKTNFVKS